MNVSVRRVIEQVTDGSLYKGSLEVGGVKLQYELGFTIPIPQLDARDRPTDIKSVREVITLKIGNKDSLEDDEFMLFLEMLLIPIIEFYNNPMVRSCNAICKNTPHDGEISALMMVTEDLTYKSSEQACAMLSEFGCRFAV